MSYFSSTKNFAQTNNIVVLAVRVFTGFTMIMLHGLPKLELLLKGGSTKFFNFAGIGERPTLILAIVLELVLSFLIMMGLFTRISAAILAIMMAIAAFMVHHTDPFTVRETSLLYLALFIVILTFGPLSYSVDNMISKRGSSKY